MKNAILLHGSSCTPQSYWLPSIKLFLEKKGYSVWVPHLPNPDAPDLKLQLPFVLTGTFSEQTIIIGHSCGVPLALSVLEKLPVRIHKAILVAGFARRLGQPDDDEFDAILQKHYDWEKIKRSAQEIIVINSDNDPWGCNDKEGKYIADHVGGKLIVPHGEGHMGSDTHKQPYKEFPLLESLL